jgi:hypothetical protein
VPWLRAELLRRFAVECEESASGDAELDFALAPPGSHEEALAEQLGLEVPAHPEGYALSTAPRSGPARLRVFARSPLGLLRAAATYLQLLKSDNDDALEVAALEVSDWPAIDLRILGGWALCRGERLREAVDLALAFKANRVLYNWWGWVPGERLGPEDDYLVEYARERGVELVCELRRMSFGKEYRISDPTERRRVLEVFESAAAAGFRSFGLLFDDVAWEGPEDECGLVREVHDRLGEVLSAAPELFACPRYYWYPGQMSLSWDGAAGAEEAAQQRRYLETWGEQLPEGVHVYLANFWADVPEDYAGNLRRRYTEILRRRPVFFDNQLINDYRLGVVLPVALQQRPADFDDHVAGYLLNAPRPLAANAPAIASALAYAWNPAAYDPEAALGAALAWQHGWRAASVGRAVNRLVQLANEWADGSYTATNHYATIWRQLRSERIDGARLDAWHGELLEVRDEWLRALGQSPREARANSTRALFQLLASTERLLSDLGLFADFAEAQEAAQRSPQEAGAARARFESAGQSVRRAALEAVREILPPLAGVEASTESADGTSRRGELPAAESPAWSWLEYFYRNTRREVEKVIGEMTAAL